MKIRIISPILAAMAVSVSAVSFGQTNTFPTSGNVGIGDLSPSYPLTVNGSSYFNGAINLAGGAAAIIYPNESRLDISVIGGYDDQGGLSAFWRGVHFSGAYIKYNGGNQYPRLSLYSRTPTLNDPSSVNYYLSAGNTSVQSNVYLTAGGQGNVLLNPDNVTNESKSVCMIKHVC